MVGGQGARAQHRTAILQAFHFSDLEWVTTERGQASPFVRLASSVRPGSYDLVLFLTAFASHKAAPFVRACKAAGLPLVYVNSGYSVAAVAAAILEQIGGRSTFTSTTSAPEDLPLLSSPRST